MKKLWYSAAVAASAVVGGFVLVAGVQEEPSETQPQETAAVEASASAAEGQPIQFPHDVHAGTYQMECQYCHYSAERSVDAGLPSVASCMGCHTLIGGETEAQQEEIAKLREYWNDREPIPWKRVYNISDHAHFPHMRHLNAGLECQECHGQVQAMGVIVERDPAWGGDNMGWCISCHRDQDVSTDCTACHY